jgi:hypothetical protein
MDLPGNDDDALREAPPTPEELTVWFRRDVEFVGGAPSLARAMIELGDYRSTDTIIRSIQRMASGDVRVSGEMQVTLNVVRRDKIHAARLLAETTWIEDADGRIKAEVEDFSITIRPERGRRWASTIEHKGGYSAPWPRWQHTLDDARRIAIHHLLAAKDALDEAWASDQGRLA